MTAEEKLRGFTIPASIIHEEQDWAIVLFYPNPIRRNTITVANEAAVLHKSCSIDSHTIPLAYVEDDETVCYCCRQSIPEGILMAALLSSRRI